MAFETVYAVPANPAPFTLSQPDASAFLVRQVGDERGAHFETMDGYTIVKDEDNWWNYARIDSNGKLASSGQRVGLIDAKILGVKPHLHPTIKVTELSIKDEQMPDNRSFASSRISKPLQAPQTGTKNALIILINFTDLPQDPGSTSLYYQNLLFNASLGANSMNNYFKEVSYNKIDVSGSIAGNRWYGSSKNQSYYGKDRDHANGYHDDYYGYIFSLAREALLLANSDINFALYDTNLDGVLNSDEINIIIVHAGCGEESGSCSGWSTDSIWSHKWSVFGNPYGCSDCVDTFLDGKRISRNNNEEDIAGYTMLAENSPLGTFAHEFGHDLGLPDLYDTNSSNGASEGIGEWGLMGSGGWLGSPAGSSPAHLSAWSKYFLGWVNPIKVNSTLLNKQINQSETNDDVYMILDNPGDTPGNLDWSSSGTGNGEYFLVENRRKTGYDAYLPGEGLLIWHIDESRGNNTDETHKLVDLEEADGLNELDTMTNRGNATDPWYNNATGFTESTNPNSSLYNGSASGVRISNISASSSVMTANLIVNWPPPIISFVPLTPANGSTLLQNYVFVNITASEVLNASLLEWNGVNESMSGSGTNWYRNQTGLTSGVYIYRVWANDSGGNWNESETRTVTINANFVSTCTNLNSPGTYTLTENITNSTAGSCINITSSDVIFDGNGHTIDGIDNSSAGVNVYNQSTILTNITVKNLSVTDWGTGIVYIDVLYGSIIDNAANSNIFYGIHLKYSNNITLISNVANDNTEYGFFIDSYNNTLKGNTANRNSKYGIVLKSNSNNLTDNTANNNSWRGFYFESSSNNTLTNNTANSNGFDGFYFISGDNHTIINSTSSWNGWNGFYIASSSNNTIINDTANSNGVIGFYLSSSNNNILMNSTGNNNSLFGLYIGSSDNNSIADINASGNAQHGFYLSSSDNNSIVSSTVNNNTLYGIYLSSSYHTILKDNTAISNSDGINLWYSGNSTLYNNTANMNHDYGISIEYNGNNSLSNNNASWNEHGGIYLSYSNSNALLNNTAISTGVYGFELIVSNNNTLLNNNAGMNAIGFGLSSSNRNALNNNTAISNSDGIFITDSNNYTLSNNNASSNTNVGILLQYIRNSTFVNNNMTNNTYNFDITGDQESDFNNTINQSNLIDGKPIFYFFKDGSDNVYNSTANAGAIYCILCSNVTIKDLSFSKNGAGVFFWRTNDSNIENVTTSLNIVGLSLAYSNNNTLASNNASSNIGGIYTISSGNNSLSNNTALLNAQNGISISESSNSTLINNNISMNGGGILLEDSNNVTFSNNTAVLNFYYGIVLAYSSSNNLFSNTVYNSTLYGIFLLSSNGNTLIGNNANSNNVSGFYLYSSSNNFISNNTALNHTWDFYSTSSSINNTVINLSIPPSISFTGKDIAIKSVSSPPSDPSGYHNLSRYINATNTSADSWLLWNVSYDESEVANLNESSLRIWRHNGTSWSLVSGTNSVDIAQNRIYANITSFSIFAPMGAGDTTPPSVTNLSVTPSMVKLGESVNITADASDVNMNSTAVYVTVQHPGGYTNTSQMLGNGSYYYVYSNTSSEDGRYNVTANASDVLGNFNNTQSTWFVVPTSFSANTSDNDTERGYGPRIWNCTNFPGFVDNEELSVLNVSDRLVSQNYLWYNTTTNLTQYYVNQYNASKLVENAHDQNGTKQSAGGGYYSRIGWMGTHYVAFNGKANKIAKLVLEHGTTTSEKKTLVVGETWDIGDGWTLTANSINASLTPRRAWLALSKNGATRDDKVVNQWDIFNYSINYSGGETNLPIFVTYLDSVFAGATSDMVQLRYTWLSSDSVTNITAGEIFGNLVVDQSTDTWLNLTNSNNSINLSQNITINLMDRIYFNVLNNTSLEYYPFMAPVHIDALTSTNTTLDIFEKSGMAGSVNITMMKDTPPGINRSMSLTPFRKYISINATQNIAGNLSWVKIRIFYSDTELSNSNLTESSLKIIGYNESAGGWEVLSTGLNTTDTTGYTGAVETNVSHFSYYGIAGTPISTTPPAQPPCTSCGGSGGGGGGGGGGTSGENYSNIELKEKRDNYIFKDKVASYKFNTTDPIMYVNITGNISAGDVTTMVEVLRNTSTIVMNTSAPGLVYKNVNIWVGTSGFATPKNMKQGLVGFRVRNSWLEEKELASGDVRLVKWNGSGWIELDTYETTKGSEHVYYEAVTDSFSPFAITAFRSDVPVEAIMTSITAQETQAPEEIEVKREETSGLNGILLVTAVAMVIIVAILAAVFMREKKRN